MQLEIPNGYANVTMVAIDPGSTTCGVAIYNLDTEHKKILNISAFTIEVDKLHDYTGLYQDVTTERMIRIAKLKKCISDIVTSVGAKIVVSEAPFYNRFMPMAYGALLEIVSAINQTVHEVSPELVFNSYAPQMVKMTVGAAGIKGKEVIKDKLKSNLVLYPKIISDFDMLDEHSLDAIAVGYTFLIQSSGKDVWT